MLTNNIILAISGCDTLRPLGIWFKPFANSVREPKYHKQCKQFQKNLPDRDVHFRFAPLEKFAIDNDIITSMGSCCFTLYGKLKLQLISGNP